MDKKGLKLGGKYKIGKKLGAGAFGEVYLGKLSSLSMFYRRNYALINQNKLTLTSVTNKQ
jgi:serine/threonine protein kinase